jgi:hypothetical protein
MVTIAETTTKQIVGMSCWVFEPKANVRVPREAEDQVPDPRGLNLAKDSLYESELPLCSHTTYSPINPQHPLAVWRHYYTFADKVAARFHPNRAVYKLALEEWDKTMKTLTAKYWSGANRVHWFCFELGTTTAQEDELFPPLLHWGIEQGHIDGVSSFAGCRTDEVAAYEKLGMERLEHILVGPSEGWLMKSREGKGEKSLYIDFQ